MSPTKPETAPIVLGQDRPMYGSLTALLKVQVNSKWVIIREPMNVNEDYPQKVSTKKSLNSRFRVRPSSQNKL